MPSRRETVALAVLACAVVVGVALPSASGGDAPATSTGLGSKPNIIVVLTDDQRFDEVTSETMPTVTSRIGDQGVTFANSFVASPLCCPSRATLITGQYGHNTGVLANSPGYPALVDKPNVLPAWLHRAGYKTALVGKFMQGYIDRKARKPAPGWDSWHAMLRPYRYFRLLFGVNGKIVRFRNRRRFYLTSVLTRYATQFVRRNAPRKRPFFLEYAPWAPHESHKEVGETSARSARGQQSTRCLGSTLPAPRDDNAFLEEPMPMPPSFDEADMSDKPDFMQSLLKFGEPGVHSLRDMVRRYRCRLASLPAVDRGVDRLLRTLANEGELDNTVIVFSSDNGFMRGEHRLALGKDLPYEETIRVPLLIRLPPSLGPIAPGSVLHELVSNIDIAPTLLDLAGADACISPSHCRVMDGRSLLPLLQGDTGAWPADRGILVELRRGNPCRYEALRTPQYLYAEYVEEIFNFQTQQCEPSDERELYDLHADPYELQNLDPSNAPPVLPGVEAGLEQRLDELRPCSGIEGRDPPPPRGRYCD